MLQVNQLNRLVRIASLAALITAVIIGVGCGGGGNVSSAQKSVGDPLHLGGSPGPLGSPTPSSIQIRLGSEPNDRIASLSLQMNTLQATNSGASNIDLLQQPVTFEFTQDGIVTSPVASLNIYQDTYSALVFPDMTGQVVFYDVTGQPVAQSFTIPAQSVPASFVLGQNALVLNVFLDLSQSFTITDFGSGAAGRKRSRILPGLAFPHSSFTVNPLVLTVQSGVPDPNVSQPESGSISFLVGTVTSVDTGSQVMTLQPAAGNSMQVSYGTNGTTTFVGCDPSTLTGMMVKLDGTTQSNGALFATTVRFIDDPTVHSEIYGLLNGYAPEGEFYNLLLDGGEGMNMAPSLLGNSISVDWSMSSYQVNSANLDLSGSQDLIFDADHVMPGQLVELENDTLALPDPNSVNAGLFQPLMFELEQQTMTGVVSNYVYDAPTQTGAFNLTVGTKATLLDTNPGLTSVTVRQIPQTYLRNLPSISNGSTVKVRGLLYLDPNCSNANYEADPTAPVDFIMVASRVSQ